MRHSWLLWFLPLAALSCAAPTKYDLVSPADTIRYVIGAAPAEWSAPAFDDSAWTILRGAIAAPADGARTIFARRKFDLGPRAGDYRVVSLKVKTRGAYKAYLNGVAWYAGRGSANPVSLIVAPGLLHETGNVLGLEVSAPSGATTIEVQPTLDGAAQRPQTAQVVKGPYLIGARPDGITIEWETDRAVQSNAIINNVVIDGGAAIHHQAIVHNLIASKSYSYCLETAGRRSEASSFTTAANPGERLRFVVYGDNRTDGDAHRRVVEAIEREQPDFLINTGDLVDASKEDEWQSFFNLEYGLLRNTPLYPAYGNHETHADASSFRRYFPIGNPNLFSGTVYGFDYGDVHVAVLNSNAALEAQAKWLDDDLSSAERRGAKHEFVVMHWGPYSSGTQVRHGNNEDARAYIAPIAKAHRADAIFAGHDHFYERGQSDALAYFVTGGGGAPLIPAGRIRETIRSVSCNHYLVVDVAGAIAKVSAKDLAGNVFDSVALTR